MNHWPPGRGQLRRECRPHVRRLSGPCSLSSSPPVARLGIRWMLWGRAQREARRPLQRAGGDRWRRAAEDRADRAKVSLTKRPSLGRWNAIRARDRIAQFLSSRSPVRHLPVVGSLSYRTPPGLHRAADYIGEHVQAKGALAACYQEADLLGNA